MHDFTESTYMYQNKISTRKQINKKHKIYLSKRETAPATTGDATLVPDNERHPPLIKVQTENTFQSRHKWQLQEEEQMFSSKLR